MPRRTNTPQEPSPRAWAILGRSTPPSSESNSGDAPHTASELRAPDSGTRERMALPTDPRLSPGDGGERPPVFTLPEALRGARWLADRRAIGGIALVVLVAAVILGARLFQASSPATQPTPEAARPVLQRGPAHGSFGKDQPKSSSLAPNANPTSAGPLVIHVVGQVKSPGVVHIPAGSRVEDAVTAAGGVLPGGDLAALNLARHLDDGEQVKIPRVGEVAPAAGAAAGTGGAADSKINLNTADESALDSLPGVGPVLAKRIIEWRAQHGHFKTVNQLADVSGVGEKLLEQIRAKVTV